MLRKIPVLRVVVNAIDVMPPALPVNATLLGLGSHLRILIPVNATLLGLGSHLRILINTISRKLIAKAESARTTIGLGSAQVSRLNRFPIIQRHNALRTMDPVTSVILRIVL